MKSKAFNVEFSLPQVTVAGRRLAAELAGVTFGYEGIRVTPQETTDEMLRAESKRIALLDDPSERESEVFQTLELARRLARSVHLLASEYSRIADALDRSAAQLDALGGAKDIQVGDRSES